MIMLAGLALKCIRDILRICGEHWKYLWTVLNIHSLPPKKLPQKKTWNKMTNDNRHETVKIFKDTLFGLPSQNVIEPRIQFNVVLVNVVIQVLRS